MRKITEKACRAFQNGNNVTISNTQVKIEDNMAKMFLWGNLIAKKDLLTGKTLINLQGYNTATTKERLNGLSGVQLTQKNWQLYLNGEPISSCEWVQV